MPFVTRVPKPSRPMPWTDDKIRFVLSTDEHIHNDMTAAQVVALHKAVDFCNDWLPNAYISTGDLGNNVVGHVQRAMSQLWRLHRPFLFCIGNHDENELSTGVQDTALLAGETAFNMSAPYYYSTQLTSGDGSVKALCLFIDCNYYDDSPDGQTDHASYDPGDRMGNAGHDPSQPGGGFYKMFPQAQLDWVAATLAADNDSDMVLYFCHYANAANRVNNPEDLADVLYADGRPLMGYSGHLHTHARNFPLITTAEQEIPFYQLPAMLNSGCWCAVTLGMDGSAIEIDSMVIHNFTNPGVLEIDLPFTQPA